MKVPHFNWRDIYPGIPCPPFDPGAPLSPKNN